MSCIDSFKDITRNRNGKQLLKTKTKIRELGLEPRTSEL